MDNEPKIWGNEECENRKKQFQCLCVRLSLWKMAAWSLQAICDMLLNHKLQKWVLVQLLFGERAILGMLTLPYMGSGDYRSASNTTAVLRYRHKDSATCLHRVDRVVLYSWGLADGTKPRMSFVMMGSSCKPHWRKLFWNIPICLLAWGVHLNHAKRSYECLFTTLEAYPKKP